MGYKNQILYFYSQYGLYNFYNSQWAGQCTVSVRSGLERKLLCLSDWLHFGHGLTFELSDSANLGDVELGGLRS